MHNEESHFQVASSTWMKHFISLENATQQDILEKGDDSHASMVIIISDENGDFDIKGGVLLFLLNKIIKWSFGPKNNPNIWDQFFNRVQCTSSSGGGQACRAWPTKLKIL